MNTLPTREGRPRLHQHSRQVAVRAVQADDAPALAHHRLHELGCATTESLIRQGRGITEATRKGENCSQPMISTRSTPESMRWEVPSGWVTQARTKPIVVTG